MSKMVAICGLICDECRAFIATQRDDDELRREVVEAWSTEDDKLKLEDIDCDGCTIGKRLHSFCAVCDVRKCGLERNVENCAYCEDFPCLKIEKLLEDFSPASRKKAEANLLELRKSRS